MIEGRKRKEPKICRGRERCKGVKKVGRREEDCTCARESNSFQEGRHVSLVELQREYEDFPNR